MQMDLWYELALREMSDVNGAATEIRREAESLHVATEEADDDAEDVEEDEEEDV
jgi:hypothetical protein